MALLPIYANTTATAELYRLLAAATDNAEYADKAAALDELAGNIQNSVLTTLWTNDFSNKNGDTGHGSFLHQHTGSNTSSGITLNPWRDNVFFPFEFNLVPIQGEDNYDAKYIEMLNDYDSEMYPVFPFFTADQVSIEEKKPALDAEFEEFGVTYPVSSPARIMAQTTLLSATAATMSICCPPLCATTPQSTSPLTPMSA